MWEVTTNAGVYSSTTGVKIDTTYTNQLIQTAAVGLAVTCPYSIPAVIKYFWQLMNSAPQLQGG